MTVKTCDTKSYELAEHFLGDDDTSRMTAKQIKDRTMSLALAIQSAVENWKDERDDEAFEAEQHAQEMRSLRGYTDEERERI